MLNYSRLMENEPFIYLRFTNTKGQKIDLVEHPIMGDMAEVIAINHEMKKADFTGFYEIGEINEPGGDYEIIFSDNGELKHAFELK